jgi:hypothetical protein
MDVIVVNVWLVVDMEDVEVWLVVEMSSLAGYCVLLLLPKQESFSIYVVSTIHKV